MDECDSEITDKRGGLSKKNATACVRSMATNHSAINKMALIVREGQGYAMMRDENDRPSSSTRGDENGSKREIHELDNFDETETFEQFYAKFELTDDTTCGFWICRNRWIQKCASKKNFAVIYGFLSCMFASSFFHFNATISTLEKRFRITSQEMGIISAGNDISQILCSILVSYYAGKGHRPRWLAISSLSLALFCVLNSLPYFLYGPGEDALAVTEEYGHINQTSLVRTRSSVLCKEADGQCESSTGSSGPKIILFAAQLIVGISASLYHTLGISYVDDNIQKSKSPVLLSFSLFFRMLGPAVGFGVAAYCLRIFVAPTLHPFVDERSPRWLGAWWLGWLILAAIHVVTAFIVGLFPKHLPRAYARRIYNERRANHAGQRIDPQETSFLDMLKTLKRLVCNPVQILNHIAGIFYYIGLLPYLMFFPKYVQTVFSFTPSRSSFIAGSVELIFSGLGMIVSGIVLSKFKPGARVIAGWNVGVGVVSVAMLLMVALFECPDNEKLHSSYAETTEGKTLSECNARCYCNNTKYEPVCAPAFNLAYFSPCHAGCHSYETAKGRPDKIEKYTQCECVEKTREPPYEMTKDEDRYVIPGLCFSNSCKSTWLAFLIGICLLRFVNTSGRLPNLLLLMRSVDERDKPVAMGFGVTILSIFAFIPAPIFFGWIIDSTCIIWGRTCYSKGNCWIYDVKSLRYTVNFAAAAFTGVGTLLDTAVWYYAKNLKMFDEDSQSAKTAKTAKKPATRNISDPSPLNDN